MVDWPPESMAYLLPLLSSLLYVLSVLFLKKAAGQGAGVWRTTAVTNLLCALLFNALWFLGGRFPEPSAWIQPALVAFLFLAGQLLGFMALQRGDVSVATPVLGVKVILVALLVTLLIGQKLPATLWIAALMSSAGIYFLSRGGRGPERGRTGPAVGYGILSAASFALFDVLVQKWSPAWGAGRFLPVMMGFVAVYSIILIAGWGPARGEVRRGGGGALFVGGLLMALQAVLLISALALYARATTVNVVYSARGLWSVLAVWWLGPLFGNRERDRGPSVLRGRLLGAALLMAAIVLSLLA